MRSKIIGLIIVFITLLIVPTNVLAGADVVTSSAQIKSDEINRTDFDYREIVLKKYLENHSSPLSEQSELLIEAADDHNLDWRLVASISGVESTFGKRMPTNSYNAYGWANGKYKFDSWEDSIQTVTQTLEEKYYNKGAKNINQIAKRYAPPSTTWSGKVKYFMRKIDPIPVNFDL